MDPMDPMESANPPNRTNPARSKRSWIATAAVATGLAVGVAGLAGAATGSSSTSGSSSSNSASASAPAAGRGRLPQGQAPSGARPDPASVSHGPNETLLTGATATKVKEAALAEVPGATVVRVETDSGGAAYEAHLEKSDGSYVTVRFDSSFKVASTEDGFGPGPQGQAPPGAPRASGGSSSARSY